MVCFLFIISRSFFLSNFAFQFLCFSLNPFLGIYRVSALGAQIDEIRSLVDSCMLPFISVKNTISLLHTSSFFLFFFH